MRKFIQSWAINILAVLVAVNVVSGIHYQKPLDLFVASLLLGILNAVLRPILMLLTLPLLQPHFRVDTFWDAFWGALVISIVSVLLNLVVGGSRSRVRFERHRPPPDSGRGGSGPVIDV